jgi:hypothetical protein
MRRLITILVILFSFGFLLTGTGLIRGCPQLAYAQGEK